MKFLPLVWRNLLRRKVRTTFTLLSIFIAFLLYAFLVTLRSAFSMGVEIAGVDRLMMMHKVSLVQLLPIAYQRQIATTPGVLVVDHNIPTTDRTKPNPDPESTAQIAVLVALLEALSEHVIERSPTDDAELSGAGDLTGQFPT